jgi:hypothetical protein
MIKQITRCALKKSPYINRIVVDFIKEGQTGSSIYQMIQVKTVNLDYQLQSLKDKLLPKSQLISKDPFAYDFFVNRQSIHNFQRIEKVALENSQMIIKLQDKVGKPTSLICSGQYCS